MITKLDNPGQQKELVYSNTGSVARLKNYLIGNEEKFDKNDLFFNSTKDNIPPEAFIKMIDENVKGLTKEDHKFYSFTINPSKEELAFIQNDKEKLKEYTRACMSNFVNSSVNLKDTKELVWGAIIHENRIYTQEEFNVNKKSTGKEPNYKVGDIKAGENSHIHIVISARNNEQSKSIQVLTRQNKLSRNFDLRGFQKSNQNTFQDSFFYHQGRNLYAETQIGVISKKLDKLNNRFYSTYNLNEISKIGNKMEWSTQFNRNLNEVIREAYQGKKIDHLDVFLEKGKKFYNENYPSGRSEMNKVDNFLTNTVKSESSNIDYLQQRAEAQIFNMFEQQGSRDERKGYERVDKLKKKNRKGKGRGLSSGL